jgi:hypothetical protein
MNATVAGTAPKSVRSDSVVKVVVMLLALGAAWMGLIHRKEGPIDGAACLREWFAVAAAPEGFRLERAARQSDGARQVLLSRLDAEDEPPRKRDESRAGEGEVGAGHSFDWHALPQGRAGTPPRQILLVGYPADRAKSLERLFRAEGSGEGLPPSSEALAGEPIKSTGGKRVLERGTLSWGEFAAPFVHEREYEAGGTFRDVVRVNLSRQERPLVLAASWTRGAPASKERLEGLLAILPPG